MNNLPRIIPFRQARAEVDIAVVYTHEHEMISRLLSTLRDSGNGLRLRLILIDNNSSDGVQRYLGYVPDTIVLRNRKRLHYAANLNRALRASNAQYTLLLNTDMFFVPEEQTLTRMFAFMNAHPDCGIAGCRIYRENGEFAFPARRFQTLPMILARRLGMNKLFQRALDDYLYAEHAIGESFSCDWLSGCFLMIRREACEDVGYFDERFRKYFEDVDLCLRMARAGWQVMYHGETYCYHIEQRASSKILSLDVQTHLRSYMRWLWKWGFTPEQYVPPPSARRRLAG
ncbi:MAG: glycosyltransferase family 2 protein [Thermoguttaceae bacterium]